MASTIDAVTKGYLTLHPAAAARTLARLDGRDIEAVFVAMPRQLAANVLEHMAPGSASRCLLQLAPETASEILARAPLLAAVAALRVMKQPQVQALLGLMSRPVAARLRLRLRFSESVIGAFVDEDVLTRHLSTGSAMHCVFSAAAGSTPGRPSRCSTSAAASWASSI